MDCCADVEKASHLYNLHCQSETPKQLALEVTK